MKINQFSLIVTIACGFICASASFAAMVEAKKDAVSVYATPSKKGNVLKTLKKGEALEAIERKGMYWKVELDKGQGYVSVLRVKRKPGSANSLSNAIRKAAQASRDEDGETKARARSAVMGVRGLSDSDTVASAGNVSPNTRVIYDMEDRVVTDQKLEELGDLIYAEVERRVERKK